MKGKDFTSDAEVAELVEGFETAAIAASEFTHVAHMAVALSYLETLPPDQALARMRKKVRAFATHHHLESLYHETLTVFWIRLLDHLARAYHVDLPLFRRITLIVARWGNSRPIQTHYSAELLHSRKARENYVPPDRLPAPF